MKRGEWGKFTEFRWMTWSKVLTRYGPELLIKMWGNFCSGEEKLFSRSWKLLRITWRTSPLTPIIGIQSAIVNHFWVNQKEDIPANWWRFLLDTRGVTVPLLLSLLYIWKFIWRWFSCNRINESSAQVWFLLFIRQTPLLCCWQHKSSISRKTMTSVIYQSRVVDSHRGWTTSRDYSIWILILRILKSATALWVVPKELPSN